MISGKAIALSLLFPLASHAAPEAGDCAKDCPAPALVSLIESLKRPLPAHTAYTEVRFVQMLEAPLVLRGELEYTSSTELGKKVTSPYVENTTIENGQVRIERPGKPAKRFSLKRAPALAGFLESFSATLAGDAQRLARSYLLGHSGDAARWQLTLKPRDPALAKQVSQVLISGERNMPLCFEVEEAGGDTSLLLVDKLAGQTLADPPQRAALQQLCRGRP